MLASIAGRETRASGASNQMVSGPENWSHGIPFGSMAWGDSIQRGFLDPSVGQKYLAIVFLRGDKPHSSPCRTCGFGWRRHHGHGTPSLAVGRRRRARRCRATVRASNGPSSRVRQGRTTKRPLCGGAAAGGTALSSATRVVGLEAERSRLPSPVPGWRSVSLFGRPDADRQPQAQRKGSPSRAAQSCRPAASGCQRCRRAGALKGTGARFGSANREE
jgi:hypothetical protein